MKKIDLVIIGGGSAGLAAAVGAYDSGIRSILIIEKMSFLGGILNQCIHNGFGLGEFKEELTGPEFAQRFISQVKERNIEYMLNTTVVNITKDKVVSIISPKGAEEIQAKAIINALGCYERNAGAIGVPGDRPSGVLTAGQAQLFLNEYGLLAGKKCFILGSGDIGLIMARRLTLEGAKVLGVAELCAWSNGLNRNMVQCLDDYGIPLYLSHTVSKVIGKSRLEAIELSEVDAQSRIIPGTAKRIDVDTLILSIGLVPNNNLYDNLGIQTGRSRGSAVDESYQTSFPGFFACGNVLHVHDLVDNVVAEAREAGKAAAEYIKGNLNEGQRLNVAAGDGIGYVVPSRLAYDKDKKATFKFRVRKPSKNVYIDYSQNGKIVKSIFKPVIIPSEMEVESIPESLFEENGDITLSLRQKEEK